MSRAFRYNSQINLCERFIKSKKISKMYPRTLQLCPGTHENRCFFNSKKKTFFIRMNAGNIRIKDIARMAGVSKGTVDRVLHKRGRVSQASYEKVMKVLE